MRATNTTSKKVLLLGAFAVFAVLIASYILQSEAEAPIQNKAAENTKMTEPRFGPGNLPDSKPVTALSVGKTVVDNEVPLGLAVTPGQQLLSNKEMRNVFDYFLAGGNRADRSARFAKLDAHLKAVLPTPAYLEANQIASDYMKYLNAFDELMVNEPSQPKTETTSIPTSAIETERFSAKLSRISRMRQSMLGVKIAQLWYADEEEDMQQNFSAVRQLSLSPQ